MKQIAVVVIMPIFLLAFNYDDRTLATVYYNSLKVLKQADGPRTVRMIRTGRVAGQSTLCQDGILFSYRNRGARSVRIAGSFNSWRQVPMERSSSGVWYYFLPGGSSRSDITYKFLVDGIWTPDPMNDARVDDQMGSYLSVTDPVVLPEGKHVSWRKIGRGVIEFRLYRPGAALVSLVGDFNNWNPEDDLMAKGRDGIWRLKKKLFPGQYRYKYVVDGEWEPDVYNSESRSDNTGAVCSFIEVRK